MPVYVDSIFQRAPQDQMKADSVKWQRHGEPSFRVASCCNVIRTTPYYHGCQLPVEGEGRGSYS